MTMPCDPTSFQLSSELIIKEQPVIEAGFGILSGKSTDQGIYPATLLTCFGQIGQQAIQRTADAGGPFANVSLQPPVHARR
ncbi:Uncharacterised protein [Serratia fonticola]|uniref:Uncharacterized protein n=1 Tax=Serratia fonticola TaxID=47917 RepID=A0A4U9WA55_SERFO|nr:Uncharacterised protein [Serratia fonticola]